MNERETSQMKTMALLLALSAHHYTPVPPSQDTLTPQDRAIPFRGVQRQCTTTCGCIVFTNHGCGYQTCTTTCN